MVRLSSFGKLILDFVLLILLLFHFYNLPTEHFIVMVEETFEVPNILIDVVSSIIAME